MNSFDPDKTAGYAPADAIGSPTLLPNPDRTRMDAPGGFRLDCRPENAALLASGVSRNHLMIQFRAEGGSFAAGPRMPLNLALAIDRSGSMEGEPLRYAQQACSQIIDLLEPSDILTIVTFAEDVDVLVPARRVVNRALLKEHVARIVTGNTTNLHDGMLVAANQVASVGAQGYVNRVLVLTDGEPTAGIRDFQSITAQAGEQRNRGVTVSALGFGPEYNEELLAGIARRSGGNYYFISRPELLPEVFRSELVSMMRLAARNAKLRIRPAKWNRVRQVYGHPLSFAPDGVEVDLADLEQGAALTLLAEMDFGPRPTGEYRGAVVEVEFEDAQGGPPQRVTADAVWTFTSDPQEADSSLDAGVAAELQVAIASQQLERTLMGMRTQQLDGQTAMLDLQRTQQILASSGRSAQAAEVTMALDNLRRGDANAAEKTLTGASLNLERGRTA